MRAFAIAFAVAIALAGSMRSASAQDVTPPSAITPSIIVVGKTTAVLNWTNSGDDAGVGCASYFEVRYSSSSINNSNFSSATLISSGTPGCSGTSECADPSGLARCSLYHFAVRLRDEANNWSDVVDVSATTNCSGNEVACP